jgi:hypothetical protein
MIVKNAVSPERTRTHHMTVSQNVSSLSIDHKTGSLTAHGQLGIE